MSDPTIVDTGPLVAFLNRRDTYHDWARSQMDRMEPPLITCEPVLAEACHLLRRAPGGTEALLEMVRRGLVSMPFRLDVSVERVLKLMRRYADVPMALADACLVRMSELEPEGRVLTLDADFRVYRRFGRQSIPVITP